MEKDFIRPAEASDLPRLTEIYNQAILNGNCTCETEPLTVQGRLDWFASHREPRYPLFVCVREGRVLGYAHISPYRKGRQALDGVGEISYYVDFNAHGLGIGRALASHLLQAARGLGYEHLLAILLEVNVPSQKLLEGLGFAQWGCLPGIVRLREGRCAHLYYGLRL